MTTRHLSCSLRSAWQLRGFSCRNRPKCPVLEIQCMMLLQLNYPYRWPTISQYNWNYVRMTSSLLWKKSLKIPKGQSESVHQRRTDNTIAKRLCFSVTIFFLLFSNIYQTLSSFSIIRDNFIQKYESYITFWHPLY